MSPEAALILAGLRAVNTLLALDRELGVTWDEVAKLIRRAREEDRHVSVEEMRALVPERDEALDELRQAVERQQGGPAG